MTVESASFISGLVPAYPPGSDSISEGDDHLRLLKNVLQGTFPNANAALNGIHTGTSAPSAKTAGTIWYDTTASNKVLKIYNGSGWTTLSTSPETDFKLLGATNVGWVLPTADGIADQFLTTDGSGNLDWVSASGSELPSQTGNSGKYLTTDGSSASWNNEIPSQTGNSGKFLTTDGSSASWAATTGTLLGVTHKIDASTNRPAVSDTYENNGMTVSHSKASATSNLYVQFDCYLNGSCNFTDSNQTVVTGYLGGSDASASTIITGTTADLHMFFFDEPVEDPSVTWDFSNTFSRAFKVTAANCPAGAGTTGTQTFNWVWKFNERGQLNVTSKATWMVWEIEE